jgi:hypothetical protein
MNWSRGLFRFWVMLSVLWIVAVVITVALSNKTLIEWIYQRQNTEAVVNCVRVAQAGGSTGEFCKSAFSTGGVPVLTDEAYRYGVAALGVPIVVLLLGFGGRWVLTGFREFDLRHAIRRLLIALIAACELGIHAVMYASLSGHLSQSLNQYFGLYALFVLAPPVIAFPLWTAGIWITRGFRPHPQ